MNSRALLSVGACDAAGRAPVCFRLTRLPAAEWPARPATLCFRIGRLDYRPIDFRRAPGARAYALRGLLRASVPDTLGALLIPVELPDALWSPPVADAIGRALRRAMTGELT